MGNEDENSEVIERETSMGGFETMELAVKSRERKSKKKRKNKMKRKKRKNKMKKVKTKKRNKGTKENEKNN